MTPDEIDRFVTDSRRDQGLPEHVEDPAALATIATVFLTGVAAEKRRRGGRAA